MKVAVTPLTRKYVEGKFRFFTLINVIPDVALPGTLIGHSRALPPPALRESLFFSLVSPSPIFSLSISALRERATRGEANGVFRSSPARA